MTTLSSIGATPSLTQARTTGTAATTTTATAATATATDTVSLSAEARAALADGQPLFASEAAMADAGANEEADQAQDARRGPRSEIHFKSKSASIAEKTKLKLEKTAKQADTRVLKADDKLQDEKAAKAQLVDRKVGTLQGTEENMKQKATERIDAIYADAKEDGVEPDLDRIDQIQSKLKKERALKASHQEAFTERVGGREEDTKSRVGDKVKLGTDKLEEKSRKVASRSTDRLSGIEERMKALDTRGDVGEESQRKV